MKVREILKGTIHSTSIFLFTISLSTLSVAQEYRSLEEASIIENTISRQVEISLKEFSPIIYYLPMVKKKSVKMREEVKEAHRKVSLRDVNFDKKTLIALTSYLNKQRDVNELELMNCQFMKEKEDNSQILVDSEFIRNLESVRLEFVNITDENLQFLRRCPKIVTLHLLPYCNYTMREGMGISKELLSDLSFLKHTLKELSLRYLSLRKEHIEAVADFNRLEVLDLRGNQLEDSDIIPLQNLHLRSLDVSDNMLTEKAFCSESKSLAQSCESRQCGDSGKQIVINKDMYDKCPNFVPTLTKLDISNNKFYGNNKSFYGLVLFESLRELNISNNQVDSLNASLIARLPLTSLKLSNISGNPIAILVELPYLMKENLRELDVTGYNLKSEDFNSFKSLKNLEVLAISLPEEKQTELIQGLEGLSHLKNLTLYNSLNEQKAVSSLGKLSSLKTLNMRTQDSEIIEECVYSLPAIESLYLAIEGRMNRNMINSLGHLVGSRENPKLEKVMIGGNFKNYKEKEKISKNLNKKKRGDLNMVLVKGSENFVVFQEYFFC